MIAVIDVREDQELRTGHLPERNFYPTWVSRTYELNLQFRIDHNQFVCIVAAEIALHSLQEVFKKWDIQKSIRWKAEFLNGFAKIVAVQLPKEPDIDPQ